MKKKIKNILLTPLNILYKYNPKIVFIIIYFVKFRRKLNLDNPKTYNEKLNWMKLNYRNELMPVCTDKFLVREYIKNMGGEDLLNEIIWVGHDPNEIPFDDLPRQFVIKVTHGSGNNIICKNKDKLDRIKTKKQLAKWLKMKYVPCYGEWFYGVIKPRIIIERFLSEDNLNVPVDYKVFCFNNIDGKHEIAFTAVDTDRFIEHKRRVYDKNWSLLEKVQINFPYEESKNFNKPAQYEKMIDYAKKLSSPFPHARIDFYVINNKLYFGEITFMSDAGFGKIQPHNMELKMGDWIKLPN
ncbi:ATP-grasp fold amidoligase family protein [Bacillus sp. EB01]|uniref:ATP-grasp fold amidoligase family protein n=1 Tax=Bacillus sp. EB01 TaxID=1347086 RepID=UPI0005C6EA26|nr:ATP-grasp fold amidoligase family protein [Bacillus sp. EB01]